MISFKRNKDGSCDIGFVGLTQEKALVLTAALKKEAQNSILAENLRFLLRRAIQEGDIKQSPTTGIYYKRYIYEYIDDDQSLFESLSL